MKNINKVTMTTLSSLLLGLFVSNVTLAAIPTTETVKVEKVAPVNFQLDMQINLDQLLTDLTINTDSARLTAERLLAEQKSSANQNNTMTLMQTALISE